MKICILSLPLQLNYGGLLQAFALSNVLEQMGHDVEILTNKSIVVEPSLAEYCRLFFRKYVKRQNIDFFRIRRYLKQYPIVGEKLISFSERKLHSRKIISFNEISPSDYDAFVVGSDQVWRKRYINNLWHSSIENAFLSFTKGWKVKRVAYAPSFGTDVWECNDIETDLLKKIIKSFDFVSVREQSGVDICTKYLNSKAEHVLDPTMLLDSKQYVEILDVDCQAPSKGNLLTYILDYDNLKMKFVKRIETNTGYKSFSVNTNILDENLPLSDRIKPSVETWLRGFYDAELVITDSFHACVFSILFKKDFFVVGNESRGLSRFTSLLSMFGLQDRLISSEIIDTFDIVSVSKIDYDEVYKKLHNERKRCIKLLTDALQS